MRRAVGALCRHQSQQEEEEQQEEDEEEEEEEDDDEERQQRQRQRHQIGCVPLTPPSGSAPRAGKAAATSGERNRRSDAWVLWPGSGGGGGGGASTQPRPPRSHA